MAEPDVKAGAAKLRCMPATLSVSEDRYEFILAVGGVHPEVRTRVTNRATTPNNKSLLLNINQHLKMVNSVIGAYNLS
jgi:hypothetical protein